MLRAGLLTPEQLTAIFLNVEELLEHNQILAEKLKDAVDIAMVSVCTRARACVCQCMCVCLCVCTYTVEVTVESVVNGGF